MEVSIINIINVIKRFFIVTKKGLPGEPPYKKRRINIT